MPWVLERSDLDHYATGVALLSSGGGGRLAGSVRSAAARVDLPVTVYAADELDASTPCMAVGHGGSTVLQTERLPSPEPFARAIAAVQRWTGQRIDAVCPVEIGGANGLAALHLGARYRTVDADLMGRALPWVDQFSVLAEELPGLVLATATGGEGVVVHADPRPADAERVLRAAFMSAGGWSGVVVAGFTVGDLRRHAILGSMGRALEVGRAWASAVEPGERAVAAGGELLGEGRIEDHAPADDHDVHSFALIRRDGAVVRVVAASEFLCVLVDGEVVAATPHIVDVVDVLTGEVLQADEVAVGRQVAVVALPGPQWWTATPERAARVGLARYGLDDLDDPNDIGALGLVDLDDPPDLVGRGPRA
ncbi:DUF917 domain-containing protein [Mobilicoccus massiliensis]|uniref:DUF917 domain-containing protein n=1 Tax=Mobilicoccus massiliensis TaxID=1522310 RepID=UPI0006936986|nr:DUF917 domain-containing protein [Mobilicoccus massiliensis]